MKKVITLFLAMFASVSFAQTFPVNNLVVNGTSSFAGTSSFTGAASFSVGPTAPTAVVGTNTTQLATTAFDIAGKPCPSILDHGGDPTDTNDNSTALTSTIAANPTSQICVYFPAGKYKFTSANSYTFPASNGSINIKGAGADSSIIDFTANSTFLTLNYISAFNSVNIRDLTIVTNQQGGSTAAIALNQTAASIPDPAVTALSTISNVVLRGADGYAVTDYWSIGIKVVSVSNVNFTNDYIFGSSSKLGTGISLSGAAATPAVVFNISSSALNDLGIGLNYGTQVQGVTVNQTNFTHTVTGINVPAAETNLDQLTVSNSQFESSNAGILESTGVASTSVSNSLFIVDNGANGISLSGCANCQFTGNAFASGGGTPNDGIAITGPALPTVITGNTFQSMSNGVFINASGSGVTVLGNGYKSNSANVGNLGGTACPATASGNCIGTATP